MKKKNRQNFTISEKVSEEFKKVCDHMSVNMSKLIENYMVDYIKNNNYEEKLNIILNNLDNIKITAFDNYKKNEYGYTSLKLSDYQEDEMKIRKIITRIVHSSNIIAEQSKCGPANTCIIKEKYYDMISKYLIKGDNDKNSEFLGDIKIIKNNSIGNFILSLRLLSNNEINIMDLCETKIDISKQYAGFEVID